jgi:hypothetical protein
MANEITAGGSLVFAKTTSAGRLAITDRITMTGDQYVQKTQSVGTTEETIDKGDITTIGYCLFKNLDATNYVELASSTGIYTIKLLAGEAAGPIRWGGTNVLARANTTTVIMEYLLISA